MNVVVVMMELSLFFLFRSAKYLMADFFGNSASQGRSLKENLSQ